MNPQSPLFKSGASTHSATPTFSNVTQDLLGIRFMSDHSACLCLDTELGKGGLGLTSPALYAATSGLTRLMNF